MPCPHMEKPIDFCLRKGKAVGETEPTESIECPCTKEACPRHGDCCACVAHHKEHGTKLPACLRSKHGKYGIEELRAACAEALYDAFSERMTVSRRQIYDDLNHWLEGFRDTETSVRKTVKTIQTHPLIPIDVTVRGFIIDSVTGKLQEIV